MDYATVDDLQAQDIGLVAQLVVDKQLGPARGTGELVLGIDSAEQIGVTAVQLVVDLSSTCPC